MGLLSFLNPVNLVSDIFGSGKGSQAPGTGDLTQWLNQFMKPQISKVQSPINQAFLQYLNTGTGPGDSGAISGAVAPAQAWAQYMLRSGGPVQKSILGAEGGLAGKGFQPGGANVNPIIDTFLSNFGSQFTSQALPLEQQYRGSIEGGFQSLNDLINSGFTANATIFQGNLAQQQQQRANQGIFGDIFGNLLG